MGINKPISIQVIDRGTIESVTVHQHHVTDAVTLDILTRVTLTPVNTSTALTLALKLFDKQHVLIASHNVSVSADQNSKDLQILSGKITVNNPQLWYVLNELNSSLNLNVILN